MTDIRELQLQPNPNAPEILVDGFQGVFLSGGVAKIDFFSLAQSGDGKAEKHLVLRMASGVDNLADIHQALGRVLEQVAQQMREARDGQPN